MSIQSYPTPIALDIREVGYTISDYAAPRRLDLKEVPPDHTHYRAAAADDITLDAARAAIREALAPLQAKIEALEAGASLPTRERRPATGEAARVLDVYQRALNARADSMADGHVRDARKTKEADEEREQPAEVRESARAMDGDPRTNLRRISDALGAKLANPAPQRRYSGG